MNVKQHLNPKVKKDEAKVVDKKTLEEVKDRTAGGKPVAFCRCWRSKTFPYCDGSHAKWNEESKDNVSFCSFIALELVTNTFDLLCFVRRWGHC